MDKEKPDLSLAWYLIGFDLRQIWHRCQKLGLNFNKLFNNKYTLIFQELFEVQLQELFEVQLQELFEVQLQELCELGLKYNPRNNQRNMVLTDTMTLCEIMGMTCNGDFVENVDKYLNKKLYYDNDA